MHGFQNLIQEFFQRLIDIQRHHILSGHHHFLGLLVVKGKYGRYHLLLNVIKHTCLASGFQHGLDFFLGHICLQVFIVHADQLQKAAGGQREQFYKGIHDT